MSRNKATVIELNVGGRIYVTTTMTLIGKYPTSKLARSICAFRNKAYENDVIEIFQDQQSRMFIDRDGEAFRYVLDYLRRNKEASGWIKKMIPIVDVYRLRSEAVFFGLTGLVEEIDEHLQSSNETHSDVIKTKSNDVKAINTGITSQRGPYYISLGCRGYYSAERDNPSLDLLKFRKITRITVSGRSDVAKEIFSEELNESRDPERFPAYGYTCRYYLTHTYLENAFETLAKRGFELVTSFSTGNQTLPSSKKDEFKQWSTYVEYLFHKPAYFVTEENNIDQK